MGLIPGREQELRAPDVFIRRFKQMGGDLPEAWVALPGFRWLQGSAAAQT